MIIIVIIVIIIMPVKTNPKFTTQHIEIHNPSMSHSEVVQMHVTNNFSSYLSNLGGQMLPHQPQELAMIVALHI